MILEGRRLKLDAESLDFTGLDFALIPVPSPRIARLRTRKESKIMKHWPDTLGVSSGTLRQSLDIAFDPVGHLRFHSLRCLHSRIGVLVCIDFIHSAHKLC
jgi:hypothetical protein